MSYLMVLKLLVIIASIKCSFPIGYAKTATRGLSREHSTKADNFVKLQNISFHGDGQHKFRSQGSQFYDPVLRNHSVLVDFVNGLNTKMITNETLEKLPVRRKRSTRLKCTGSCERSLCPWTMHWNEDATRVPQFIRYAKCQTDNCNFSFATLGQFTLFKLGIGTQCETVTTDIFSTKEGKENWITGWPIACICAKVESRKPSHKPVQVFFSGTKRRKPQMMPNLDEDTSSQNYYGENRGNDIKEYPNIYLVVDDRSLTDSQWKRLLMQETLKRQHLESFEEVMERERKRTSTLE